MNKIYLSLILHNHQPVGNYDFVIADAYQKTYEPMLTALERHPAVRVALHYSGPLRDWLIDVTSPISSSACARWWAANRSKC